MTDLLDQKVTRRRLLGCAGISVAACGGVSGTALLTTDLLDRLQGKTDMPLLEKGTAWTYDDNVLTVNLDLVPELEKPNSAIRLEADSLPGPLLIVHTTDAYTVFLNKCPHNQKKVDLENGELKCTCISASTFDLAGEPLSGPAKKELTTYMVEVDGSQLIVSLA
jgi:nitrite reductase/ring-hydroxylating ferredoxin subunit